MYDAFFVRCLQRLGNLPRDGQSFGESDWTGCHSFGERRAINVLHHDKVWANVVQGADVRMIQCSDGAGLALEALAELLGGDLNGDDAVEAVVGGLVNLAH